MMDGLRRVGIGLGVVALLAVGGWQLFQESESGQEFAEKNAPVPSPAEAEATINDFEQAAFGDGHNQVKACNYLTPRSFRELVIGSGGKDPGRAQKEAFQKACPVYLAIIAKASSEVPRIHVEEVEREEYEGRYVLIVRPQDESLMAMNYSGKKIESFGLAAAQERAESKATDE